MHYFLKHALGIAVMIKIGRHHPLEFLESSTIHPNLFQYLIVIIDFKWHGEVKAYIGLLGAHLTLDDSLMISVDNYEW